MSGTKMTCRLCMNTEELSQRFTDLFKVDGGTTLDKKVCFCIDLKMHIGDGLPVVICKICEKNVLNFYDFKKKCLFVDSKLRTTKNYSYTPNKLAFDDSDFDNIKMDVKLECNLIVDKKQTKNKLDSSELKNTFDSWLSDDADSVFYVDYFNTQGQIKPDVSKISSHQRDDSMPLNGHKVQIKKQSLRSRKKSMTSYTIYQCEICGRIVKNKTVLAKHIATHSGIKQFSCKLCPKTFTRAEHKVIHMRTHLGIKPYICEVCGRSFTKRQDLIRHMKIHSDEKKYACPRCNRRFKRSGDVHTHMRTHTGMKPYSCSHCEKSYTSHSGLRKHYNAHCKKINVCIK